LATLHDPRAIAPLVQRQALDTDPGVRDAATHALSVFPRDQALPYVMAAYGSDEAAVRKQVLLYISTEPSALLESVLTRALGDVPEVFQPAAAAFHALPNDEAMRILVAAAADRDPAVRRGAVVVLRQMQSPAAAMAIREVYERDIEVDEVHDATRRALRDLRRFLPIDPILQAAANSDRHVRARALKLLGVLGGPQAQQALLDAVKSDDAYIRGTAVSAMVDLGSPDVVPVLEKMTQDPANQRILPLVRHTLKALRDQHHDVTVEAP
jgi:HEAT repeat protein